MLTLAKNQETDYSIVYSVSGGKSSEYAAGQLASYLGASTGAVFPVVTDDSAPTEHEIIIGRTSRGDFGADYTYLGDEGFTIRTEGEKVIIAGGIRGALYGAYTFLEDYVGCRFFTADCEKIPEHKTLGINDIDDTQKPVFEYRDTYWSKTFDETYRAKVKLNSSMSVADTLSDTVGGSVNYGFFCHTLARTFVSRDKYLETNPEYFALNPDGTRTGNQLCLTNPDVLRLCIEEVREYLTKNPHVNICSLTQDDNCNPCQCKNCRAVDSAEGGYSGTMIRFVNAVAEALEDEFPDVAFDTFAYQYTLVPPQITVPRPNVIVRMCSILCCSSHPLADMCGHQQIFYNNLPIYCDEDKYQSFMDCYNGWAEICSRIYVWHYTTDFAAYCVPFPNFSALPVDMRTFADNNVRGVFMQGNGESPNGEFDDLRAYLTSKLLWNPRMTSEEYYAHMDDFLEGYYGKGWKYIREYIDLIQDKTKDTDFTLYSDPTEIFPCVTYYENELEYVDRTLVDRFGELFDAAQAASAGDETALAHIEFTRISVLFYTRIIDNRDKALARSNARYLEKFGKAEEAAALNKKCDEMQAAYIANGEHLYDLLVKYGVTKMREGGKLPEKSAIDFSGQPGNWN